ncbi:nuclear transport factor 2 family protein [Aestuariivivens sp. NBU2969]|uniref:nuclear transport factor 2 family protein n=1 Tax=Aestuariivivens sp. NBU2969 TaxID=2873267 RepID=UPI001CC16E61|nr:ester cyclase [Aestuariivivens sp. NBU2969]
MKRIICLITFLGCFISCNQAKQHKTEKIIEKNLNLANSLMELWESGDTTKSKAIFHKDCEYIDIPNHYIFKGIDGVNKYVRHVHNWGSNIDMEIRNINISEKIGYAEWTFKALQSSPITGRIPVATNKKISIKGVTVLEFNNGKIQKATDYMDVLGFVLQLGSNIELPGGITIGKENND